MTEEEKRPSGDDDRGVASKRRRKWDLDDQGILHTSKIQEPSLIDPNASASKTASSEALASGGSSSKEIPDANDEATALASAKEAAARINAMLVGKEEVLGKANKESNDLVPSATTPTLVEVPSEKAERSISETLGLTEEEEGLNQQKREKQSRTSFEENQEAETDADTFKETVDVNDSRHRYYLIRSATVEEIEGISGAHLTVRGKYYPDRSLATEKDPPLCLEVSASSEEALHKAINRINELKESGPPPPKVPVQQTIKVFAPFESDYFAGVNIRQKIIGPQGAFLRHIQKETTVRVNLRGKGSGHVQLGQKEEPPEPLHLLLQGERIADLERAKQFCEDLLATVKSELEATKMSTLPPMMYGSVPMMGGALSPLSIPSGTTVPPPPPPPMQMMYGPMTGIYSQPPAYHQYYYYPPPPPHHHHHHHPGYSIAQQSSLTPQNHHPTLSPSPPSESNPSDPRFAQAHHPHPNQHNQHQPTGSG